MSDEKKQVKSMGIDEFDEQIKRLTQEKLLMFMKIDPARFNDDEFYQIMHQVKMGSSFTRDREMTQRIQQGQVLRVINFVSGDSKEFMEYIQGSLPEINIAKKKE